MKIFVPFVFTENQVDPIYKQIGLETNESEIEVVVDGYLDLDKVVGCSEFYDMTHVYLLGNQNFLIDLPLEEFRKLWI